MAIGATPAARGPLLARVAGCAAAAAALMTLACCHPDADAPGAASATIASRRAIDSLRASGRYGEALAAARARRHALERTPAVPRWTRDDARREVATLTRIAAAPESVRAALALADAATPRAESLLAADDRIAAMNLIESQLAVRRRHLGPRHPETAASMSALARLALEEGQSRRAHDLDLEALAIRRHTLGGRHPDVAESLDGLGLDLKTAGASRDESMRLYRQALALRTELLGPESPEAMSTLTHIANLYRLAQRPDSALAIFRRVLDHARRAGDAQRELAGEVLFAMAMTLTPGGAWSEAEPLLREAVEDQRALGPRGRIALARSLGARGLALQHLARSAEAESLLAESAELFESLRRIAAPGLARAGQFPLLSYNLLAAAQLERGHEREAWLSLERSLARSLLEDLAVRGAVDTSGWWDGALARVQGALSEDAALIGWLTLRPGAAAEDYPFWCYCIRARGPVH